MGRVWVVALVVAGLAVAGCTGGSPATGNPAEPPTLVLYVSNQSFEDDQVAIRVEIDERVVVDDSFDVADQHNWVEYELAVPAGSHTLRATSGTGVTASHELELPAGETRWAVLEYWYDLDSGPRSFTFRVDDQPVGFD